MKDSFHTLPLLFFKIKSQSHNHLCLYLSLETIPFKFSEIMLTSKRLCFLKNCAFLRRVLSAFRTDSLHYFAKLGMVQRNLELKRVFPGTSRDSKCSRDASSIQTRYPSRPLRTFLLKQHRSAAASEQSASPSEQHRRSLREPRLQRARDLPRISRAESRQSRCAGVRQAAELSPFINREVYAVTVL